MRLTEEHSEVFKKIKARVPHVCSHCGNAIQSGEEYYREDRFLHSLHPEDFCTSCRRLLGDKLLEKRGKKGLVKNEKSRKLDNFTSA